MSHQVKYTIRRIVPAPTVTDPITGRTHPATAQELADLGLVRLDGDLYSCVHQERRDPDTLVWAVHDHAHPGEIVAEGAFPERHAKAKLPPGVAPHRWAGEAER